MGPVSGWKTDRGARRCRQLDRVVRNGGGDCDRGCPLAGATWPSPRCPAPRRGDGHPGAEHDGEGVDRQPPSKSGSGARHRAGRRTWVPKRSFFGGIAALRGARLDLLAEHPAGHAPRRRHRGIDPDRPARWRRPDLHRRPLAVRCPRRIPSRDRDAAHADLPDRTLSSFGEPAMELLGEIIRLQIQTTSLKIGERPHTRYDPAGIVSVPRLGLEPGGVNGFTDDGTRLDDVHHAQHPRSKSRGTNAISVLFTAHYDEIRNRFGDWLADGIAGENILVRCDRHLSELELRSGIRIASSDGAIIDLERVVVADPCVEFSRYAMRFP